MSATSASSHGYKKLILRSYEGYTSRDVSDRPARDCTDDEVPMVDLSGMFGDLDTRRAVAQSLLKAAETSGFFYIKNHSIDENVLLGAHHKAKKFFRLPVEQKQKLSTTESSYGYQGLRSRQVNPSEGKDRKELFNFHYEPEFDPAHKDQLSEVPARVRKHIPNDRSAIWQPNEVEGFKEGVLAYWQACLSTSRQLIRLVALALDLPEDYFDRYTTYPGGDFGLVFYPGHSDEQIENLDEVGIGTHTDLQILTLLWQDEHKGLQVLNSQNEWTFAPPIPGTLVVNIGDFLMRLTNDRLKSTVHREIQHGRDDRYSMPFFFGFNFDEKIGVVPTCTNDQNPPKYEPATCGEVYGFPAVFVTLLM
ncbi:hypothetical protein AK830_g2486 [Neonectria ditissima]|uniref:Fe2OG dioxygenase domain-containing protein n=1 Tax=Neonectria ditissima TaxID=78410 RepID=A0A0P7BU37_9HYPO|nr:hypothetical protein AK830_g2486 [Neonectria ditissima]